MGSMWVEKRITQRASTHERYSSDTVDGVRLTPGPQVDGVEDRARYLEERSKAKPAAGSIIPSTWEEIAIHAESAASSIALASSLLCSWSRPPMMRGSGRGAVVTH